MRKMLSQKPVIALTIGVCVSSSLSSPVWAEFADNACKTESVSTVAQVRVSDGSEFGVETLYTSPFHALYRRTGEGASQLAVEGPTSWAEQEGEVSSGSDFTPLFVLGHQYHALMFLLGNRFEDGVYVEQAGLTPFPKGAQISTEMENERLVSMEFQFPDIDPIQVRFQNWKMQEGRAVPYQAVIDDGQRQFTYDYDEIAFKPMNALDFASELSAAVPAETELYRLHRALLAAHCLGDADMMVGLSADQMTYVSNGSRRAVTSEQMRQRFETVFEQLDYQSYSDLALPVIEMSDDGSFGVAHVAVRAEGESEGEVFSQDWAWTLTARKFDQGWKHTGNSSSAKVDPP